MEIVSFPDKPDIKTITSAASAKLSEVLKAAINTPTLLLLSGGSALALLDEVKEDVLGPNITIGVLDERYSEDARENNFAQVVASPFYSRAVSRGVKFIDTHVNGRTQEQLAKDFNNNLLDWFKKNPGGTIIATIGMGPDGHTSGMMPFPENPEKFGELFEPQDQNNFVTSYDATGKNPHAARVTTNMNLLRKINTAIVYITGESKREAFERLSAEDGSLAETPARVVKEIEDSYLFTDL